MLKKLASKSGFILTNGGITEPSSIVSPGIDGDCTAPLLEFIQEVVDECVKSIETIDRTHMRTTYDKQLVDETVNKAITNIKIKFR